MSLLCLQANFQELHPNRSLTVVAATNPEVMKEKPEMLTNAAAVTASMFVTNTLQAYTLKPEQTGRLGDEN